MLIDRPWPDLIKILGAYLGAKLYSLDKDGGLKLLKD